MNHKVMNKIQKGLSRFLLLLGLVCVLVLLFVPMAERALEKTVRGRMEQAAAGFGLSLNRFQVVNVGLNSAHFRNVEIGKPGRKKLKLPDIHISYTFSGIRQGKISAVHVVGMTIHARINRKGKVRIAGLLPLNAFMAEKTNETKTPTPFPPVPDIFVDNAFVFLETPYGSILIPGTLACRVKENSLTLETTLFPEGGVFTAKGKLTLPVLDGRVDISWNKVAPGHWLSQLAKDNSFSFSGTVSGKASLKLTNGKPAIGSIEAWTKGTEITFKNTFIKLDAHGKTILTGNIPEQIQLFATIFPLISENIKLAAPAQIQLVGKTLDSLRLSAPEIKVLAPFPVTASLLGRLTNINTEPVIQGHYSLQIPKSSTAKILPGLPTTTIPVKVTGKFIGKTGKRLPSFMVSGRMSQALSLSSPKGKLTMDAILATVKLSGNFERAGFATSILVKDLSGSSKKATIKGKRLSLQATGKIRQTGVTLTASKGTFSNFDLNDGSGDRISGLSGDARFSPGAGKTGGTLSAALAATPDISFSHIKTDWKKVGKEIAFTGIAALPVPVLKLSFDGSLDPTRQKDMLSMRFRLPETVLPEGTDLSPIVSSLKGFSATGTVKMTGKITMPKDGSPTAIAKLKVHSMAVATADNNLTINGIDSSIEFTNLLNMVSRPSQQATVATILAGPAKLENGKIRFQLLNEDTVSVEAVSFGFAGGDLSFSSFLLSGAKPDMDIGVYCHQLALTSLLNLAIGSNKAKGSGTVSGYIPLNIRDGDLVFGKGFLQSVPGKPGTIRIKDSKDITGGVVLAEEAVKDFTYQWARVNLESRNGNLNLLLQLDGKPNRKLPLIYDEKIGDFVKAPDNQRHVALQGLKLDLKFVDIDINRLLKQPGKVKFSSK